MPGTPWFRPGTPIGSRSTVGLIVMFVVLPLLFGGGLLTVVVAWGIEHSAELTLRDWVGVVWTGLIGLGASTALPAVAGQEWQRRQKLRDDLRAGTISPAEFNHQRLHPVPPRWTPQQMERWSHRRQLGPARYVWRHGVLGFGLPVAISWVLVMSGLYQMRLVGLIVGAALVVTAGGVFYGLWTWTVREGDYHDMIESGTRTASQEDQGQ